MAKALFWACPDTERRKLGERVGLDTLLVLAVNDGNYILMTRGRKILQRQNGS